MRTNKIKTIRNLDIAVTMLYGHDNYSVIRHYDNSIVFGVKSGLDRIVHTADITKSGIVKKIYLKDEVVFEDLKEKKWKEKLCLDC